MKECFSFPDFSLKEPGFFNAIFCLKKVSIAIPEKRHYRKREDNLIKNLLFIYYTSHTVDKKKKVINNQKGVSL